MKKNYGITLIVLIITIIVMLILVAVTIQVVINSGLLKTAGDAVSDYKNEQEKESYMDAVTIDGVEYESIEDYLANKPKLPTIGSGDKASTTSEYKDTNGDIAVIPGGFTVSGLAEESTIDDGLVIYLISEGETVDWSNPTEVANAQRAYDQFVWIPIKNTTDANAQDINDMYICQAKTSVEQGACRIELNENGEPECQTHKELDEERAKQMAGRLYATSTGKGFEQGYIEVYTENTGLREPDVITDNDRDLTNLSQISNILGTTGYDTISNFKQSLQSEYNEVAKSIYENQGFYIGRYETSNMIDSNTSSAVKSVAGTITGISDVTWYRMYAQQKKYAENNGLTSIKSTMIQGTAYDQVMKFIENGARPDGNTYTITIAENVGHGSLINR